MTEQDWLTSTDPLAMLQFVHENPDHQEIVCCRSDRKLRLFAVACCRQVWHLLTDQRSRRAVKVAERYADGEANEVDLHAANCAAIDACCVDISRSEAIHLAHMLSEDELHVGPAVLEAATKAGLSVATQANLLRDIVGNPYRPVTMNQAWLTPTVVSLAQAAYEEREQECKKCRGSGWDPYQDSRVEPVPCVWCHGTGRQNDGTLAPDLLAILADALEDAGCVEIPPGSRLFDTSLLLHLRSPGPHVRGCWAIDLLLGKE